MTGHQILKKLKNSITDVEEIDETPNKIETLNEAKDVIKRKLTSIDVLSKRTIKAVCNTGEAFHKAKKLCKNTGKTFKEFISELEVKKDKISVKTADNYIRIYKLCKDFPKFLSTSESFRYFHNNHKIIRQTLADDRKEHDYWSQL